MAAGGTYGGSGVVPLAGTLPVQKGSAYVVAFAGSKIPASGYVPQDGAQLINDYRHKVVNRDIAGNVRSRMFGGAYQRATLTLNMDTSSATAIALKAGDTVSVAQVTEAGGIGAGVDWIIEEDPVFVGNRENNTIQLTLVKPASMTFS